MNREVLAVRHVHFEDLGSLEQVLGERAWFVRYLDVGLARVEAPNPEAPALTVVLGGPISACDDASYPTLKPLLALLEKRIAAGLPTLGICLGAQLIARVLGARVHALGRKEIGWSALTLTEAGRNSPVRTRRCCTGMGIRSICRSMRCGSPRRTSVRIKRSPGGRTCSGCSVILKFEATASSGG